MTYKISLLSKKDASLIDKTLYFFLNYLRYILVFTQIIVIGVLFFRFRIDQNIIDLKDSLNQKKEIVEAVTPLLQMAERVNDQTVALRKITTEQDMQLSALNYILSVFPESIVLTTLNISEATYTLKGTSTDPRQLQLFYSRLLADQRFKLVSLSNIIRTNEGYVFDLVLETFVKKT